MTGPRASAAERQRRFRIRAARGRIVLPVEIDEHAVAGLLIDAGYMPDTDDRRELARGLSRLIAALDIAKIL